MIFEDKIEFALVCILGLYNGAIVMPSAKIDKFSFFLFL